MPLDQDCLNVHALYEKAKRPPLELQTPQEAREGMARSRIFLQPDAPEVGELKALSAPGPSGPIPLRLYRPRTPSSPGVTGCLIYFHGGGWVIGDLDSHDVLCRQLANYSGHTVISVDYRLAPEHRFPAAIDDSIAATRWIAQQAAALNIDPKRLAVGGDSAGGNLAAAVALALKTELPAPLKFQLLIYPAVDATMQNASVTQNADVLPLTRNAMLWFWEHYAGGADLTKDWRASPLHAKDHTGLPPAFVSTAGYDVLLDEGKAYADKLGKSGVPVEYKHYPGMVHGFITMGKMVRIANTATRDAASALAKALA
jgi:acetyl esterase